MISFLILPMQRVTRLPLLMDVRTVIFISLFFLDVLLMLSFVQTQFLALSSLFVSSDLCQAQGCRSWSVDEVVCSW